MTKYYQDLGAEEPVWHHVQEVILNEASRPDPGTVSLRVWTERLEVYADRLLKNVFSNLLDNAVRHGKGATDIVVTYRLAGDGLDLVVEDNGPGIPDTDKEAILRVRVGEAPGPRPLHRPGDPRGDRDQHHGDRGTGQRCAV